MPNDRVGRPLKLGDKVLVPFIIHAIHNNDDLALQPELEPAKEAKPLVHLDSNLTYRLNPGDVVYTGIPPDDGDGDQDDGVSSGASDPPPGQPGGGV